MSIDITSLYHYNRVIHHKIWILLYTPLGLFLVLLRGLLAATIVCLGCILPNYKFIHDLLHKGLCITFGVRVYLHRGSKNVSENVDSFISNYITILDQLAVHSATNAVAPGMISTPLLASIFGTRHFGSRTDNNTDFCQNVKGVLSRGDALLYFQPEGCATNGRAVIKFSTWPFQLVGRVQPIAIAVHRPLNIAVNTIGATYWSNIFFFMFCPYTKFHIHFLPPHDKKPLLQDDEQFAQKIQQDIANCLEIESVEYCSADLKAFEKKYIFEQRRILAPAPTNTRIPIELQQMGTMVKEVLPMVPLNVIYKDLKRTRSVDITITNILEGHVHFTPEQPPPVIFSNASTTPSTSQNDQLTNMNRAPLSSSSSTQSSESKAGIDTTATTFGRNAKERSFSYQERKQTLIENARQRYLAKHGINKCVG